MTTTLLAIVDGVESARVAGAAGAGRVALHCLPDLHALAGLGSSLPVPLSLIVADDLRPDRWVEALRTAGATDLCWPAEHSALVRPSSMVPATVTALVSIVEPIDPEIPSRLAAAGFDGLMLAAPAGSRLHLTARYDIETLAALIGAARASGLRVSLSGALETPDVPRLLALQPDELGVEFEADAVRRLAAFRDIMAGQPVTPSAVSADGPDCIFVRDWVFSMSIGAYARERGSLQNVRVSIEADTMSRETPAADMRNVVSYDLITDTVRRLAVDHFDLVETFAEAIARGLLIYPGLVRVFVTIEKLDLGFGVVGCRIVRRRP